MIRALSLLAILLAGVATARQESKGEENWYSIQINGAKSGWARDSRKTLREGDREIVRSESSSEMRIKRLGDEMKVLEENTFDETPEGAPLRLRARVVQSAQDEVYSGEIRGDKIELTVRKGKTEEKKTLPWKADYLSPVGVKRVRRENGFAPGTSYSYWTFSVQYGRGVKEEVKVVGTERLTIAGEERELTKLETSMDILPGVKGNEWVDETGETYRTFMNFMGIQIARERSDRATALLDEKGNAPEMMVQTLLRPKRKLKDPRKVATATYQITVTDGEADPKGLTWDGQTVDKVDGKAITLTVAPIQPPGDAPKRPIEDPNLATFLEETTNLQCKDPRVVAAAKEAVGDETDAWKAAKKIERWVHDHIQKKNFGVGFATAAEVAERLEGDCTEHAVLAAAMARAVGIPSRVAVGLVSVSDIFGGHMWFEVWVGRWVPLDATIAQGLFDATHIKMAESAATGTGLQNDFLGMLLYMGKIDLQILDAIE